MITLTRRVTFAMAHSDWLFGLSPEENRARFGPEACPEPYGHNYQLDVSIRGEIDARTGIVINIKDLDRIVRENIVQDFDKKYINQPNYAFNHCAVTPETLVEHMARSLASSLPEMVALEALRLEATPQDCAEWRDREETPEPEGSSMLLTRSYEFSASHRLHSAQLSEEENRELFGKCNYPHGHGHNYIVEITVAGPVDPRSGRVVSPELLDQIVNREVVDRYDHRHLNLDIPEFQDQIPSSEVVTKVIWERLHPLIPEPARLYRVLLRETARNFFEYRGEESNQR